MTSSSAAQGVRWNLTDLYRSPDDPQVEIDLSTALQKASEFEKKYRPLLEKPDVLNFPAAAMMSDYQAVLNLSARLGSYAFLSFSEKTDSAAAGAFLQKIQTRLTAVQNHLVFLDVLWTKLSGDEAEKILLLPEAEPYRHYLKNLRVYAPHTLSEPEEKILAEKANTSARAFARLFDETVHGLTFAFEGQNKTESEVLALLHSPDRETRRKASESLAEGLQKSTRTLNFIFNRILEDHRLEMKLRSFAHPMTARNLANETNLDQITGLIRAVKKNYPLAQRYYRLKQRLLGLEELFDYDRYAPLEKPAGVISFTECREIVTEGYRGFSAEAGKIAGLFFEKNWIDAELRSGKRGGGFCSQTSPEVHPYILVNYTGSLRDVMTVAHEIGHGIHQVLAGRRVGILECAAPLTLAETASVFGEMLIFEKLLSREEDPRKRLVLLAGKIDDNFATVFRQIAMTDFELRAHEAGLLSGELSEETLSGLWMEANAELYGSSVKLTQAYRHGWKYIPHFIHSPFYCYAYAFAQLFVFSLFSQYKEKPDGFAERFFEILSLGGSKKPEAIARIAGLDLNQDGFWDAGLSRLENLVSEAEELARQTGQL